MVNYSVNKTSSIGNERPNSSAVVQQALSAIQGLNLTAEICGSWIWISGADASHEVPLRAAQFRWSYKRGCWYFCPTTSKPRATKAPWEMDKIREKFGSHLVQV